MCRRTSLRARVKLAVFSDLPPSRVAGPVPYGVWGMFRPMTDTWDQFSRRLALVYALVALVVLVLYLAFDFQRSWSRSVSTLREQAVAALSWAERGMDAASEAMSSAATAGSRACVAGAVEPRVLSHMLNVPLDRVTIATGGRVLCEWTAPQSTLTACSTASRRPWPFHARRMMSRRPPASIPPACSRPSRSRWTAWAGPAGETRAPGRG